MITESVPAESPVAAQRAVVHGISMSALVAAATEPRAVILALHGGAVTSRYFDSPGQPGLSLLRTGAALGYTVVALDRPGYGASSGAGPGGGVDSGAGRAELAWGALDALLAGRSRGAGVFALAHSAGCGLALRMAAGPRGGQLLGLELAGTGRYHHHRARLAFHARLAACAGTGVARERAAVSMRDLIWAPAGLYPPRVSAGLIGPAPAYEGDETRRWSRLLPRLAARVRVPVRYTLGDHESVWQSGPAGLAEVASLFTASPRVLTSEQPDSGHNLSLGWSARAYHLQALAFAEECALAQAVAHEEEVTS